MRRELKGIVFQTREVHGSRVRHRFYWTSDSAGDVIARVEPDIDGVPDSVEFSNSDTGAETYAVTLLDGIGRDWLLGLGAGKATNDATRAAFVEVTVTSAESRVPSLPSGLYFKVDCSASAERSGIVDIWTRVG